MGRDDYWEKLFLRTFIIYLFFAGLASIVLALFRNFHEVYILSGALLMMPQTLHVVAARDVHGVVTANVFHLFLLVMSYLVVDAINPEIITEIQISETNFKYLIFANGPSQEVWKFLGFTYLCFSAFFVLLGSLLKQILSLPVEGLSIKFAGVFLMKFVAFSFVVFVLVESTSSLETQPDQPRFTRGPASVK